MFDPFVFDVKKSASQRDIKDSLAKDKLDDFRCQAMLNSAKQILLTSHESEEAYLGAITVLMLNGVL